MSAKIESLTDLAANVLTDTDLANEIKANPAAAIANIASRAEPAFIGDKWIYRIVVLVLGIAILTTLAGLIVLTVKGSVNIPDGLVAIGSAAVGALAGLLAPSPRQT